MESYIMVSSALMKLLCETKDMVATIQVNTYHCMCVMPKCYVPQGGGQLKPEPSCIAKWVSPKTANEPVIRE
jgi:hypothetical protein